MKYNDVEKGFDLAVNMHSISSGVSFLRVHSAQERRAIVDNHLLDEIGLYVIRKYILPNIRSV